MSQAMRRAYRISQMITDREGYLPCRKSDLQKALDSGERQRIAKALGFCWSSGAREHEAVEA